MGIAEMFLQKYSNNGIKPQEAISEFKGVTIRDPFSSRICDCDDCDTFDCAP